MAAPGPEISIVVPCYNERDNVRTLVDRLVAALGSTDFEIVFVDDGSRDGSPALVEEIAKTQPRVRLLELSRNFGHQAALAAGLDDARGKAVVIMDADLQDPPELVPEMIARWRAGADVVYAVRRTRKEGFLKRAAYKIFYRSMRMITAVDIPLDAGDFSLLDGAVVDALRALPEKNRFLRGLRSWVGFTHVAVPYDRPGRNAGETKYTLRKLVGLALSGYVGFSSMPLRAAAFLGFFAAFVGFGLMGWVIWTRFYGLVSPRGWASTSALVLFMGGVQLLTLGVIGEYLGRVYDEVRRRPTYVLRTRGRRGE